MGHKLERMKKMQTLAQKVAPGLKTESEILAAGFALMKKENGSKAAKYYFWYNEDFPSDFLSEYIYINKKETK